MGTKTTTIFSSKQFELIKVTNTKTDRTYYKVNVTSDHIRNGMRKVSMADYRTHFDPGQNRCSKYRTSWKFKNRKIAEQLIMTAIIKWSE